MNRVQIWNEIVKIQPRGVITIPAKLRKDGFRENDFVRVREVGGRLLIEPVNLPRYSVRRYTDNEVEEFFEMDKDESQKLK